jgi:hypothetical protein
MLRRRLTVFGGITARSIWSWCVGNAIGLLLVAGTIMYVYLLATQ